MRTLNAEQAAEFRNLLNIVLGRAELLAMDERERPSARNAGRIIQEAERRIEELFGIGEGRERIEAVVADELLKKLGGQ